MRYNGFASFEEIVETLDRGNEIEFQYEDERYSLSPRWTGNIVSGYTIGHIETNDEAICETEDELADFTICGETFAEIFDQIEVIRRTI